jgi:hypothetical protein
VNCLKLKIHHNITSEITSNTVKILADLLKLALIKFHMEAALKLELQSSLSQSQKNNVEQSTSSTFAMEQRDTR